MDNERSKLGIRYSVSGNAVTVGFRYGTDGAEVLLDNYGGNGLFDFRALTCKETGLVFESHSDWHGPFIMAADCGADGDHPLLKHFTGGNHRTTDKAEGGGKTARSGDCILFADGEQVADAAGSAREMEIRWSNYVQGYNTARDDGKGREILREEHRIRVLNGMFFTHVELVALEDLKIERWYGFQCVLDAYPVTVFSGARNGRPFRNTKETDAVSGDLIAYEMTHQGSGHRLTLGLDPEYGLGKRNRPEIVSGEKGMFVSGRKAYFSIINGTLRMCRGERCAIRGFYMFEKEE